MVINILYIINNSTSTIVLLCTVPTSRGWWRLMCTFTFINGTALHTNSLTRWRYVTMLIIGSIWRLLDAQARWLNLIKDVRILRQKNANSACRFCEFCATFQPSFFYGTIACDTGVLSRVSWLVGPLKLRVTIQLTLSLCLPTTGSSNDVVWRMFIVYICERRLTTSGILCNFNSCKWKG